MKEEENYIYSSDGKVDGVRRCDEKVWGRCGVGLKPRKLKGMKCSHPPSCV